jgi:hypothetical protein
MLNKKFTGRVNSNNTFCVTATIMQISTLKIYQCNLVFVATGINSLY